MAKFQIGPWVDLNSCVTARVGSAANAGGRLSDKDIGKIMTFAADSRYALAAEDAAIEGFLIALEPATQDGFSIGTIQVKGRVAAVCDGLEATNGTGTIAVGDYVVCSAPVAHDTALTIAGPKVCKATYQPGADITNVNQSAELMKVVMAPWRVVALGDAGAVGDTCIIERV